MQLAVHLLTCLLVGSVDGRRSSYKLASQHSAEEAAQEGSSASETPELGSLNDVSSVSTNTCLCCSRHSDYVDWGYETRDFCKMGYLPGTLQILGKFSPFSGSRASACDSYCSQFPEAKFGKLALDSWSMTAEQGRNLVEETKADMSYRDHCMDETVRVSAKAGRVAPAAEFNRAVFEANNEQWDRVVAELSESDGEGECVTRYVLECPENPDGIRRSAIGTYKTCCEGAKCTPPERNSRELDTDPFWLRGETWNMCVEQNAANGKRLYTSVDLDDAAAYFAKGTQVIGLRDDSAEIGCMKATVTSSHSFLKASYDKCPQWLLTLGSSVVGLDNTFGNLFTAWAFNKNEDTPVLSKETGMFDRYTSMMYGLMIHMSIKGYALSFTPAFERMGPPKVMRALNKIRSFELVVSDEDVDKYDNATSGLLLGTTSACAFVIARDMTIRDDVGAGPQSRKENAWAHLLNGRSKMEYLESFFAYKNAVGEDVYPTKLVDYVSLFKQGDLWNDDLERHLAFTGIGSHRAKRLAEPISQDGETAVTSVDMSIFGHPSLKLRDPDFAPWGANMHFSAEGRPLMVKLSDGREIWQSKAAPEEWQYAKFVWRSTLINGITLVDHLWYTHFYIANKAAISSRELLSPAHPLRHLFGLFTWGTPQVNQGAAHQLVGPYGMLHRMTPFRDFGVVAKTVQDVMPTMEEFYGPFFSEKSFDDLPDLAQKSPFYEDGKDFFAALKQFVDEFFLIHELDWCSVDGHVHDADIIRFLDIGMAEAGVMRADRWKRNLEWLAIRGSDIRQESTRYRCAGLKKLVLATTFGVTGFHRHVGTVADLMRDPEMTSPSWVTGERSAQPRQAMQAALIAATTGFTNPKLGKNKWAFMFSTLRKHRAEVVTSVEQWEDRLHKIMTLIDERNVARKENGQVQYFHMHPGHVENSVAV